MSTTSSEALTFVEGEVGSTMLNSLFWVGWSIIFENSTKVVALSDEYNKEIRMKE